MILYTLWVFAFSTRSGLVLCVSGNLTQKVFKDNERIAQSGVLSSE
jgi:hypothetical protein